MVASPGSLHDGGATPLFEHDCWAGTFGMPGACLDVGDYGDHNGGRNTMARLRFARWLTKSPNPSFRAVSPGDQTTNNNLPPPGTRRALTIRETVFRAYHLFFLRACSSRLVVGDVFSREGSFPPSAPHNSTFSSADRHGRPPPAPNLQLLPLSDSHFILPPAAPRFPRPETPARLCQRASPSIESVWIKQ